MKLFYWIRYAISYVLDWVIYKFTEFEKLPYVVERDEELYDEPVITGLLNVHPEDQQESIELFKEEFFPAIPISYSDPLVDCFQVDSEEGSYKVKIECTCICYRKRKFPWREYRYQFLFQPTVITRPDGRLEPIDHIALANNERLYRYTPPQIYWTPEAAIDDFANYLNEKRTVVANVE
jgi:hypothetical protein